MMLPTDDRAREEAVATLEAWRETLAEMVDSLERAKVNIAAHGGDARGRGEMQFALEEATGDTFRLEQKAVQALLDCLVS